MILSGCPFNVFKTESIDSVEWFIELMQCEMTLAGLTSTGFSSFIINIYNLLEVTLRQNGFSTQMKVIPNDDDLVFQLKKLAR